LAYQLISSQRGSCGQSFCVVDDMAKRELRCEIEISFIEGARFHVMTGNEWKLYTYLWARAVAERKEDLGWLSSSFLARKCNLSSHYIGHYLQTISTLPGPLLQYHSRPPATSKDTYSHNIVVLWVASKHPKLKDIQETSRFNYKSLKQNKTKRKQKETKPKKNKEPSIHFPMHIYEKMDRNLFKSKTLLWLERQDPVLVQRAWEIENARYQDLGDIKSIHGDFVNELKKLIKEKGQRAGAAGE
jgi:hypothetical protein